MPGGAYSVYAHEVAESGLGAIPGTPSASYNIINGGSSNYLGVTAPLGMNLLGIALYMQVSVTNSGATTTVSGSDQVGLSLSGYEVTNQVGGGVRCKTLTTAGLEEAERLYLGSPSSTNFASPRATPTTFTSGVTTATYNAVVFIPSSGGQSANLRVSWPGAGQVFTTAANISAMTCTFYPYALGTLSSFKTAFQEVTTRTVGAGQSDFATDVPAGMAPDIVSVVGKTWGTSSTNISKVVIDSQGGGGRSVDYEDIYTGNALQTLFPQSQAANQSNVLFNMHKQRADHLYLTTGTSWSAAVPLLFCELDDGNSLSPTLSPAQTAAPSIANNLAGPGPGGAGVVPRSGATRSVAPNTVAARRI